MTRLSRHPHGPALSRTAIPSAVPSTAILVDTIVLGVSHEAAQRSPAPAIAFRQPICTSRSCLPPVHGAIRSVARIHRRGHYALPHLEVWRARHARNIEALTRHVLVGGNARVVHPTRATSACGPLPLYAWPTVLLGARAPEDLGAAAIPQVRPRTAHHDRSRTLLKALGAPLDRDIGPARGATSSSLPDPPGRQRNRPPAQ